MKRRGEEEEEGRRGEEEGRRGEEEGRRRRRGEEEGRREGTLTKEDLSASRSSSTRSSDTAEV